MQMAQFTYECNTISSSQGTFLYHICLFHEGVLFIVLLCCAPGRGYCYFIFLLDSVDMQDRGGRRKGMPSSKGPTLLSNLSLMFLFSPLSLQLSVDTVQFLLFLYIQQLNRMSLRTSLIGEEWPSQRTRSPSPSDREAKTSSQNKVLVTVKDKRRTDYIITCFAVFCNPI